MLARLQPLAASIRDAEGHMVRYPVPLYSAESILSQVQQAHLYPELSSMRAEVACSVAMICPRLNRWEVFRDFRIKCPSIHLNRQQ